VAHNGVVVRRQDHERVVVQDGDTLEIVHIVGGGSG
jgi:thiamine biosynthesis protein ThiS